METKIDESQKKIPGLRKYLSPLEVWALAFGCSVGWGAFVMPGTTFLPTAGPFGTAAGLFLGSIVMVIIAANYHFMMNRIPDAGGIFSYSKKIFGYDHGFLSSWFLILTYIAIIWANATALAVIARKFLGETFQFGYLYTIAGYDVYLAEVCLSIFAILICGLLCVGRKKEAGIIQTFFSCLLIAGILICACDALSDHQGGLKTFEPAFFPKSHSFTQIFEIIALAPWAFVGFESVSHSVEEFNFSPKKSFKIMTSAIFTGFIAYLILAEVAVSVLPERFDTWVSYILHLGNLSGFESLPTAYAINFSMGETGIKILGVTVFAGVMTGLIGNYIGVSRLLYSMAKDNLLPESFAKLNENNTPANAIFFIMLVSLAIPFFGRTAIDWVIDVNTVGATIAYAYTSAAAFVLAREENNRTIKITGGIGIFMALIFNLFLLLPNIWGESLLATESYLILVLWSIFGFCVFRKMFHEDKERRFGKSVIAWTVMLFLIFFCSLIWMRQSADKSLEKTVNSVSKFYENELDRFGYNDARIYRSYQEKQYLEGQMKTLRTSLLIDSIIQMCVMFFSLFVMFNIYSVMMRREKDAQHAKLLAEENSKAKTTFLSNMSHDIRTPMNAIIGYTNLARREGIGVEEMKNFLAKIDTSSQHLLSLINDVLEMSRIESGRMELDESENNLVEIVQEIGDMFATQMKTKKINFVTDTSNVKNKFVMCDKNRINRILLNLTSNAYKFTPEGGKISITLLEKKFGEYELRVKDSGIGMSEDFAKEVFEPFTRERTSTVSGIQGTGLGMAITKNFTDLMKGKISVETAKGKGTEFILNFNFAVIEKVEVEEEKNSEQNQEIDFTRKKLLLVEDIEVNREIALMVLGEFGFQVETAVNGQDAVEKISSSKPGDFDAILMDIQMPKMNGYEATKKIRALENPELAKIPIIAMTANAFSEDVENARAAGMNAHIAKPLDVPKMLETLSEVLRQS